MEIVTDGPYDFDARYNAGRSEYFVPARLTDEETSTVKSTAERVHRILGLRHLSRTDIVLDGDGVPWVLDVNVAPRYDGDIPFPAGRRSRSAQPRHYCRRFVYENSAFSHGSVIRMASIRPLQEDGIRFQISRILLFVP